MKTPKSKMKAFDEFYEKNGYRHKGDPRHAMNRETTRTEKMKKGGYAKPQMMKGGMANKKQHMYAGGGSVMENLTPGQRRMVSAMARDNKQA